jgi:HEAT repeat protein
MGKPILADESERRREQHLLQLLRMGARKRQAHLQALAQMWSPQPLRHSCFRRLTNRLSRLEPSREALELVASCIEFKQANARLATVLALAQGFDHPDVVVPALVCALRDHHVPVRLAAADALLHGGERARAAAPELRRLLDNRVRELRWRAAHALARIEPGPEIAGPLLDQLGVLERHDGGAFSGDSVRALRERISRAGLLDPRDHAALLRELEENGPQAVAAAGRLSLLDGPAASDRVIELLVTWLLASGEIAYASALGRVGERIVPKLEPLAQGSSAARRGALAALRLGRSREPSWIERAIHWLEPTKDVDAFEDAMRVEALAWLAEQEGEHPPLPRMLEVVDALPASSQKQLVRELHRPTGRTQALLMHLTKSSQVAMQAKVQLHSTSR